MSFITLFSGGANYLSICLDGGVKNLAEGWNNLQISSWL